MGSYFPGLFLAPYLTCTVAFAEEASLLAGPVSGVSQVVRTSMVTGR